MKYTAKTQLNEQSFGASCIKHTSYIDMQSSPEQCRILSASHELL